MQYQDKQIQLEIRGERFHCAMDVTNRYLGGKWRTPLLWHLREGSLRYSEIKAEVPEISDRILARELRKLLADGLIIREELKAKEPKIVLYSLSSFGRGLLPVLRAMSAWGQDLYRKEGTLVEQF